MSGVTAIKTATGTTCVGQITLTSTVPTLLSISNTPTAPYTVNFAPINANIATLNGKTGNALLQSSDNTLNITPVPLSQTIQLSGYVPTASGGKGSALVSAQNLTGTSPLAWAGSTATPPISTLAYTPGALVIYNSTTFICLVAQPIGSALPVAGANWAPIGGGGTAGSSISQAGGSVSVNISGQIVGTAAAGENIFLTTSGAGNIALTSAASSVIASGTTASLQSGLGTSGAGNVTCAAAAVTISSTTSTIQSGDGTGTTGKIVCDASNITLTSGNAPTWNGAPLLTDGTKISQAGGSVVVNSTGGVVTTAAAGQVTSFTGTGNFTVSAGGIALISPTGVAALSGTTASLQSGSGTSGAGKVECSAADITLTSTNAPTWNGVPLATSSTGFAPTVLISNGQTPYTTPVTLIGSSSTLTYPAGLVNIHTTGAIEFPMYPSTTPVAYTLTAGATYRLTGSLVLDYSGTSTNTPTDLTVGINLNSAASFAAGECVPLYYTPTVNTVIPFPPTQFSFDVVFTAPANAAQIYGWAQFTSVGLSGLNLGSFLNPTTTTPNYVAQPALIIQRLS
jgi:hypothetical protein